MVFLSIVQINIIAVLVLLVIVAIALSVMLSYYLSFFQKKYFQEANKRNNNWLPPPWAIVALVILGFNEFMTLLRYLSSLQLWYQYMVFEHIHVMHILLYTYTGISHGRNPLYLGVIFVGYLLIKALWVQLDISGEFRNGAVSVINFFFYVFYYTIVWAMEILKIEI